MDYYVYTEADKNDIAYRRCFADAENGRIWLALLRLKDLRSQFPNDAHIDYAEALLRIEYLGEGIKAQKLCWKAYQSNAQLKEALFNSVKFSPDRNTFHNRISEAIQKFPNEPGIDTLYSLEENNRSSDEPYWRFLYGTMGPEHEERAGECAAILELLLNDGGDEIPPIEYAKMLRYRGESLRKLDRRAENRLQFFGERFLSEDRLALRQALNEFEQYIDDPYFRNPESLNLCGVWSMLLGFHNNALKYADEAINLGGEGYIYPHKNKALTLWEMGNKKESILLDEETLKIAEKTGDESQVDAIRKTLDDHCNRISPSNLTDFIPFLEVVFNGAGDAAYQEITAGKSTLEGISSHFLQRLNLVGWNWSVAIIPMMSEMLAFFSPEAAHFIIEQTVKKIPANYQTNYIANISYAIRFLAAYSEGVLRRDAIGLITLQVLTPLNSNSILNVYRQSIYNISNASDGPPLSDLSTLVYNELSRISLELPHWLEDQPPVTTDELDNTRDLIKERFLLTKNELDSRRWWSGPGEQATKKPGCMPVFIALFSLVILILRILLH